jgi:hypothetical protein
MKIPIDQIVPAPIGPPLTDKQISRATAIHPDIAEVMGGTLDEFLENLQRDAVSTRDEEINFWETVAKSLQAMPGSSLEAKRQRLGDFLRNTVFTVRLVK